MDAIEALKTRRSVRAYTMKAVDREVLEDLVECGRLAASAMNQQPWEFVVVEDPAVRREIADLCEFGSFIADAPAAVLIAARETGHYREDTACAAENIMVAARAYELSSCWVQVHDKANEQEVGQVVGLPEDLRVVCVLAVGYADPPPPPPKRALDEVLHWGRYGSK